MGTLPYWQQQAITRQRIIMKQDRTIADLTASVVQLEDDCDNLRSMLEERGDCS